MHNITLAQSTLSVNSLRSSLFWSELDAAIQRLHGTVMIHHSGSRDYRLSSIEMQIRIVAQTITVTWVSRTAVLDTRCRIDLRQSADAWLDTLSALMLRPATVCARVQAASALLAAGFDSVAVSSTGISTATVEIGSLSALAA